jgi:hypothetical protein
LPDASSQSSLQGFRSHTGRERRQTETARWSLSRRRNPCGVIPWTQGCGGNAGSRLEGKGSDGVDAPATASMCQGDALRSPERRRP